MFNVFERLASSSRSVVERVHGKDVTIFPVVRAGPNAPLTLSTIDAPYVTSACFYENTMLENEAKAQPLTGGNGRLMHRSLLRSASIRLIEGKPLKTDFLMRREDDGALFSITQFDPDGLGTVLASVSNALSLPGA